MIELGFAIELNRVFFFLEITYLSSSILELVFLFSSTSNILFNKNHFGNCADILLDPNFSLHYAIVSKDRLLVSA